jgi:hypothetical protein
MNKKAIVLKALARMGKVDKSYFMVAAEEMLKETTADSLPLLASAFVDARISDEAYAEKAVEHCVGLPVNEKRIEDLALGLWGSYLTLGSENAGVQELAERVRGHTSVLHLHRFRRL